MLEVLLQEKDVFLDPFLELGNLTPFIGNQLMHYLYALRVVYYFTKFLVQLGKSVLVAFQGLNFLVVREHLMELEAENNDQK